MLIWLLACHREGDVLTLGGRQATLRVEVVNPANCSYCDAFAGVDTLRVDVRIADAVVASDSFAWPEETPELPDLPEFGVVRVEMVGISGGVVVSAGRTAEVAMDPEAETTVPLVFLPANTAIPLIAEMRADRSRHVAWRRPDGTVALLGGVDPERESTFSSVEHYDPASFAFVDAGMALPASVAAPRVDRTGDGDRILAGGFQAAPWGEEPSTFAAAWVELDDTIVPAGTLNEPHHGHCFSMYRDRIGILFGGNDESDAGELVKPTGDAWSWSRVPMFDFDVAQVTGCVGLADQRVFLQGTSESSTGTWTYDEGDTDPGRSFTRMTLTGEGADRFVRGALLRRVGSGAVWVVGGEDVQTGEVLAGGRFFDPTLGGFRGGPGLVEARYDPVADDWIRGDWLVVGGGWSDSGRRHPVASLEWVDPVAAEAGPRVPLDRDRDGPTFTTLLDGSVLVAGGFDAGDASAVDAALVVPWFEGD